MRNTTALRAFRARFLLTPSRPELSNCPSIDRFRALACFLPNDASEVAATLPYSQFRYAPARSYAILGHPLFRNGGLCASAHQTLTTPPFHNVEVLGTILAFALGNFSPCSALSICEHTTRQCSNFPVYRRSMVHYAPPLRPGVTPRVQTRERVDDGDSRV